MGLDVIWKNGGGVELGAFHDHEYAFVNAVLAASALEYPSLARIDEYRDTTVPPDHSLLEEVIRLRDAYPDPGGREQLTRLVGLLRQALNLPGSYLQFRGD